MAYIPMNLYMTCQKNSKFIAFYFVELTKQIPTMHYDSVAGGMHSRIHYDEGAIISQIEGDYDYLLISSDGLHYVRNIAFLLLAK